MAELPLRKLTIFEKIIMFPTLILLYLDIDIPVIGWFMAVLFGAFFIAGVAYLLDNISRRKKK